MTERRTKLQQIMRTIDGLGIQVQALMRDHEADPIEGFMAACRAVKLPRGELKVSYRRGVAAVALDFRDWLIEDGVMITERDRIGHGRANVVEHVQTLYVSVQDIRSTNGRPAEWWVQHLLKHFNGWVYTARRT